MKLELLPSELTSAKPVLNQINQAGFQAYFVGGCVRDIILEKPIHDVDIASSAYPEEIKQIFKKTVDTGIQHGTVMVLDHGHGYEITTFRTESTYTDFRRPDQVTFVRSLSEDLKRRDFTINAFALQADGQVIDYFDGLTDLSKRQIRAVGQATERFTEDALRMMRALRFSAQLDFAIEDETFQALVALGPNLAKIAVERIQVEFEKMLQGIAAGPALRHLIRGQLLPYLPGKTGRVTDDYLAKVALQLEKQQPQTEATVWTLYLGQLALAKDDLQDELRQWKLSRNVMQTVTALSPLLANPEAIDQWAIYEHHQDFETLMETLAIMGTSAECLERINRLHAELPVYSAKELALSGGDLIQAGLATPGPALGQYLHALERAVVLGEVANTKEAITVFIKELADGHS
ncbi:polynucleotide adenylyltransferase [Fructobacillus pseudoficulneus]|uniref:CCA-adding enzyme n=1 Tax=Fructobacillus pseudoficulneus TaxID=220714 RepID=A0A3F3GQZ9_9LACO|nr:CCA tRNA nucleotidyltransferase [Fructobacillus pseudoficulneus]GAP02165.1 polynucleotide adenylyltransferase [Fructobacillus pseudoficulneus]SEH35950.1 tRNA nucleotidyltransferase (CCA-adding enzyme) [Fructobacillus pseudoficulneus]